MHIRHDLSQQYQLHLQSIAKWTSGIASSMMLATCLVPRVYVQRWAVLSPLLLCTNGKWHLKAHLRMFAAHD